MTAPLYYVHDVGGMCNRIFPFAHLIATSIETQRRLFNPTFDAYKNYFVGTNPDFSEAFWREVGHPPPQLSLCCWRLRYKLASKLSSDHVLAKDEEQLLDIEELRESGELDGKRWLSALYAIDNAAFVRHAKLLRQCFRPIPSIEAMAEASVSRARTGSDILIGVHIRQGDYAQHRDGMMYFETSEYRALMARVAGIWPERNVAFLVCSNVRQPSQAFEPLHWHPGPGDEIGDLAVLSRCDFIIGAPSTFSAWASFSGRVPRYVYNRKYEEKFGVQPAALSTTSFAVHRWGFGKYSELN